MANRLPLILACALLAGAAGAAELGDARVASFIGQPLVADVELTLLAAPASKVDVRLAHPDVYRGANIGMPPVLSTLTMTVMQRDGRQFLRVTSRTPVESSHLHLYLELLDGGQRDIRLVTLTLAPDPHPVPPPPPVPVPVPAPPPAPIPVVLAPAEPPAPVKPAAPRVHKPVAPPRPQAEPTPKAAPEPVAAATAAPKREAPPLPLPVMPAAAATCAPASDAPSQACAALDYKSAQLREQIGVLEDKVKVLQVALGANPAALNKPVTDALPRPHPSRKRHQPAPQAEVKSGTPWGWIGAGIAVVLALAVLAVVLWRRRKGQAPLPPGRILMKRLRQRIGRKKTVPDSAEPKVERAGQEMSTQL